MRILVVSDVRLVQEGMHMVLAHLDGVEAVHCVDMLHARDRSAQLTPEVVLVDAARHENVERVKDLVAAVPDAKVVAFGVRETDGEIVALAEAGTAGYVRDSAGSGDVIRVLERVLHHELPCSPGAAASLYRRVATLAQGTHAAVVAGNGHADPVPLSGRELQIAHLIGFGLSNKELARELGIESTTVKNHVHNICHKLKVHRRGEIAARIRTFRRAHATAPESMPVTDLRPDLTDEYQ
ncbi:MAG TPA: response regulator transcription factor [Steroidobacteraceae bacterium]|nr:response regulator transcription factor [Steroidobacteraceae bacterium]